MELVCNGLSKNPYITSQRKRDTIMWFKVSIIIIRQSTYLILFGLKGLSHEIDFESFDKNLQHLAKLRDAAGF
jgi:hypothetical protein